MPVNTTTSAAHALNIGTVGIVGTFLGMPLEALILGAAAGAVAHGLNRSGTRANGIATVITSTLLAGAFSPALVAWLALNFHLGEPEAELLLLKPLVPVWVGAAWPWALPLLEDGAKKLLQGWISRFGGGRHE